MTPLSTELFHGLSSIPTHPSFLVYDSTKIQTFMLCPRDYFYKYVLGWRPIDLNFNLVFGKAWHDAMEVLQYEGHDGSAVRNAYNAFMEEWTQFYAVGALEKPPSKVKTPERALKALALYAAYWSGDIPEDRLYTELCGSAPIREDRVIHFKMDAVRRHPSTHVEAGKIFSLEHKTTAKTYLTSWEESWSYSFQVACYNYALWCLVEDYNEVDSVTVNGLILWPKQTKLRRIPIRKSEKMLQAWLEQANYWIDQIEHEMEVLAEDSPSSPVMRAFQPASSACAQSFGGCDHPHHCAYHSNPLQHLDRIPADHKVEYWDPREREKTAKKVVHFKQEKEVLV